MASDSDNTTFNMEEVLTAVKAFEAAELATFTKELVSSLPVSELFKLLKAVAAEAEKKSKQPKTTTKTPAAKKTGSMPKGAIPQQLKKPRAWVEFTLKHALENGWEPFTVLQKKKDKETNVITEEQIEMPGSILHEGAYIYKDSVSEKTPTGKQIIHKEAMSLSKQRKENHHPTYAEFEASYVDESSEDDKSVASSTASQATQKKIVVKKTAAEKEAEAAAKKAQKEAEKAAQKAQKEAEKEAKKAEKEAEKEAKKAEKEAEKEAKKAEKKPVVKAPVPAAAVKKTTKTDTPAKSAEPAAEKPATKKKAPVAKQEDIPNDGMVHPWTYKGKKYLRNADGETWTVGADGGVGEWVGLYNSASDKLDTSAPEPAFEDDE